MSSNFMGLFFCCTKYGEVLCFGNPFFYATSLILRRPESFIMSYLYELVSFNSAPESLREQNFKMKARLIIEYFSMTLFILLCIRDVHAIFQTSFNELLK